MLKTYAQVEFLPLQFNKHHDNITSEFKNCIAQHIERQGCQSPCLFFNIISLRVLSYILLRIFNFEYSLKKKGKKYE